MRQHARELRFAPVLPVGARGAGRFGSGAPVRPCQCPPFLPDTPPTLEVLDGVTPVPIPRIECSENVEARTPDPPRCDEAKHGVHENAARRREAPLRIPDPLRLAGGARGEGDGSPCPVFRVHLRQVAGDLGGRANPEAPPQAPFPKRVDPQPDPVPDEGSRPGQPKQHRDRGPPEVIRGLSQTTDQ